MHLAPIEDAIRFMRNTTTSSVNSTRFLFLHSESVVLAFIKLNINNAVALLKKRTRAGKDVV